MEGTAYKALLNGRLFEEAVLNWHLFEEAVFRRQLSLRMRATSGLGGVKRARAPFITASPLVSRSVIFRLGELVLFGFYG